MMNGTDHQCEECEHRSETAKDLGIHKAMQHMIEVSYSCCQCDQRFSDKPSILQHIALSHLPNMLEDCGYESSDHSSAEEWEEKPLKKKKKKRRTVKVNFQRLGNEQ